jgi:hypothetical protein
MLDKITQASEVEQNRFLESIEWLKSFGGFNTMPEPYEEITEDEYFKKMNNYSPDFVEYRQVLFKNDKLNEWLNKYYQGIHIYWFHDEALAFVHDYWGKKTYFFRIGCNHEYRELGSQECRERGITHWGNCWHVYECKKCGHSMAQDSSG